MKRAIIAIARAQFNLENEARLVGLEARKREELAAKLAAEKADVIKLRETMCFKAKPVTVPRSPLRPLQQQQELTIPESPALMTKARASLRPSGENSKPTLMSQ